MAIAGNERTETSKWSGMEPWPEMREWKGPVYDQRHYNSRRLKSLVRRPLLQMYSLTGETAGGPLRVMVADDGGALPYFRGLIFPEGAEVRRLGAIPSLLAPRLASADCDIVIVAANQCLLPLYRRFHYVPKYVRPYLAVSGHPDAMLGAMSGNEAGALRRNVRKSMEAGFEFELTRESSWFESFYQDYYRPFVLTRFEEGAIVDSYQRINGVFRKGFALVLKKNGEMVGGSVMTVRDGVLYWFRMGLANSEQMIREGASAAIYYFGALLAYSWGCRGVDLGHSRPFLSDGVLRYKLKWGAEPADVDDGIGFYALATPHRSPQGLRFAVEYPFYEMKNGRVVLCDEM